jgi:hypothetical protein
MYPSVLVDERRRDPYCLALRIGPGDKKNVAWDRSARRRYDQRQFREAG